MKMTGANAKISYSGLCLAALLSALILCAVLIATDSFGWFSKNQNVGADGAGVSSVGQSVKVEYALCDSGGTLTGEWTEIGADTSLDLAGSIARPGDTAYFKLRLTNVSSKRLTVDSAGFAVPDAAEEVPKTVDTVNYYFGTQLTAKVTAAEGAELAASPTPISLYNASDPSATDLITHLSGKPTLADGETLTLTVCVTFTDTGVAQDEYKNFGQGQETCARRLYVEYTPEE